MEELIAFLNPDTVEAWVKAGGYLVIFGLLFACGLGLPLPEDIPLILGGFFAGKGDLNLALVSVVAWCGIIGGDCVLYSIAKKYGLNITKVPFIGSHVTQERIIKAEHLFEKYGIWIVAIGRLFAGIRGAMVIAAGAIRFNFVKFVIADGLAALVSGGLFIAIGLWAGKKFGNKKISEIRAMIKPYEHWIIAGIAVAAILAIAYIWFRNKKHQSPSQAALDKLEHRIHPGPDTPPDQGQAPARE